VRVGGGLEVWVREFVHDVRIRVLGWRVCGVRIRVWGAEYVNLID
jgi:hypothetical protein